MSCEIKKGSKSWVYAWKTRIWIRKEQYKMINIIKRIHVSILKHCISKNEVLCHLFIFIAEIEKCSKDWICKSTHNICSNKTILRWKLGFIAFWIFITAFGIFSKRTNRIKFSSKDQMCAFLTFYIEKRSLMTFL